MKKYIKYNLFLFLFFFCSLYGQKKDTLFIKIKDCNDCLLKVYKPIYFTDNFYGEYETVETEKGLHVPRLKKERFVFSNDLLKNKDVSKYQIGVETRKCFNNYSSSNSIVKCDINNYNPGIIFYHISISNDFVKDYMKYSENREKLLNVDTLKFKRGIHPFGLYKKSSGEYIGKIEELEKKFATYTIDFSIKKAVQIEEDLKQIISDYTVVYLESEKIGNEILFQEVSYQYEE